MALIGEGEGHGGFTLLHALGAGYGCSVGIDLSTKVRLRDNEPKKSADDPSGVLEAVVEAWVAAGLEKPAEELFWQVRSTVPIGQGLKSSAALSVAAIKALCEAGEVELTNAQIVDISANAQMASGVSMTGSVDDAWAAIEPGWKIVNPNLPAAEGILMEGEFPSPDDWKVLIVMRGNRELLPDAQRFAQVAPQFEKAIVAMEQGALGVALTENGRATSNALGDGRGRRLANDLLVWGARSAGISGSGPAIAALVPSFNESVLRRIEQLAEQRGHDTIVTDLWTA
ncbi:MAG: hypothetical protein QF807_04945 [Candidatus Thalassarchaeaceae archaeon]|jgi:shikimate kinase|nr:hypothetical protein [Candidatus Thalassarchaeaceae archaeon]MDP7043344.1 hypothetical protein [Candidatus Thalassarchaeaceae archaeon]